MCCADKEELISVLHVNDVHATATALDLVRFLEDRSAGNRILACKLMAKKGQPIYRHGLHGNGAGIQSLHQ